MFIHPEKIIESLENDFLLSIKNLAPLSLGADADSAVYKAETAAGERLFVKLRRGDFDPLSVELPMFLSQNRSGSIIPVIQNRHGNSWQPLANCHLILYPFVQGQDGYERRLSPQNWDSFGQALKQIHTTKPPKSITRAMRQENFDTSVCNHVKHYLEQTAKQSFSDPVAHKLSLFLNSKQAEILELLGRVERLAIATQAEELPFVVCHSDLHAGNLLILADESIRIVDWDAPILAPKERDLMYIGGALLATGLTSDEEQTIFYKSYGETKLSQVALTYYRCERIAQDIFAYCRELLDSNEGSAAEREESLSYLMSNFEPGRTIDSAYRFNFGELD